MNDKTFTVEVSSEELTLLLKKSLNSPHAAMIARIIIGNLEQSSVGLKQLFRALNGIDNESKWKVGMEVQFKRGSIYSSKIDDKAMIEAGVLHQDYMKGTIIEINLYTYSGIKVEYDVIYTGDPTIVKGNQPIDERYIIGAEEWPEQLEKVGFDADNDPNLPF